MIPILATRGCPYKCTFCTSPNMWTTAYIARDPKKVVDEIEFYIKKYNARNFPFQDLTAITKKSWIISFCQEIIDRGLKFKWQLPSGTRSEVIDDEVAPLLKAAGMLEMGYAPESGSQRIRDLIKKQVKADKFYGSVRSAMKAGLHVQCFFIVGLPDEEIKDVMQTWRMIAKLAWMGVQDVAIMPYMPYPGSALYDQLLESGKVELSDKWLLAPLHTHGLIQKKERMVNENFSAVSQSIFIIGGFAIFYGISMVRRPVFFAKMLVGIFTRSAHDVSRLQKALKKIVATKPRFRKTRSAESVGAQTGN